MHAHKITLVVILRAVSNGYYSRMGSKPVWDSFEAKRIKISKHGYWSCNDRNPMHAHKTKQISWVGGFFVLVRDGARRRESGSGKFSVENYSWPQILQMKKDDATYAHRPHQPTGHRSSQRLTLRASETNVGLWPNNNLSSWSPARTAIETPTIIISHWPLVSSWLTPGASDPHNTKDENSNETVMMKYLIIGPSFL